MSRSRLSSYLRTERMRSGLSQRELAELVGYTPNVISKAENGDRRPSIQLALCAEIIFEQQCSALFPGICAAFELEILLRAVALEMDLSERNDAVSKRKRAHLSALINRLQFNQTPL